ncbi:MAG: hypothetical protein FJ109_04250 [Deltaproteobacteria bacterium]|nr:hypothetical protein [Deltaproteobacteria bacterium]
MTIWEGLTWANVVILGLGAPVVFWFFLRDVRSLLTYLTAGEAAAEPPLELALVQAPVQAEGSCQSALPPL